MFFMTAFSVFATNQNQNPSQSSGNLVQNSQKQNQSSGLEEYETIVIEQNFNSSSKVVIDKKEIERSHAKDIPSLLANQANISISQSNVQPNSIFLRGGDSSHILILVDGVPYYDPTTVQRTINLSSLNLKSVQKIEVLKGSQSVLYGGQALAGVIKIETIPTELKTSGQVMAQAGTQSFKMGSASGTVVLADNVAIVARGSYSQQDSSSPILDSTKTYPTSLSTGELAYVDRSRPVEVLLKLQTSFDQTQISDSNPMTYQVIDVDDFNTTNYQLNETGVFSMPKSQFSPVFTISNQRSSRLFEFKDLTNPTKQEYVGNLFNSRFEINPFVNTYVKFRAGLGFTNESMNYDYMNLSKVNANQEYESIFLKTTISPISGLDLELGGRTDYKRMKNPVGTGHVGVIIAEKLKLEGSTGFKNPSLFQLYSSYGNPNLQSEKSESFSVSYENNYYNNQVSTSATLFLTKFKNLIIPKGSPPKYENVAATETKGIEFMVGVRPTDTGFSVQLTLGYQEPRDLDLDNWLPKRPLRTGSVKVRQEFQKLGLGLELIHNGDRRDKSGSTAYTTLNPYTVVHLTSDYSFTSQLTAFLRLQNLTNQRYEASYSYYSDGFTGFAGLELGF